MISISDLGSDLKYQDADTDLDRGRTSLIIFPRAWKQVFGFKILKFFNADPNQGFRIFLTLDPESGMEKFGSGIRDKHPRSATLAELLKYTGACH